MPFLAPVIGAIGAAWSAIGIIGQAVVGIGINLAIGAIEKAQAKKAQKTVTGTQFERDYGENVSRKVVCGLVGLAGHDCYVNTYGKSNKNLSQVYVLSDFPCDGLSRIWAGGTELPIVSSDGINYSVSGGDYDGLMTFVFHDGSQTAADATLVSTANPAGRWTTDFVGTGVCYLIASLKYDQDKLNSFPDFFFEIRGARLYDIRKDSTIGGTGAHRWGVYSTYEFSQNPAVQEYNYRRGFSINGDMFCGMGMDQVDLPIDRYATAANICDETVDGAPRYRCSIILDTDSDHGDNIEAMMTACGGIVIDSVEGSWPLIGTAQPIIETFTDDDLVSDEPVRFQKRRSMADLVNAVSGTYPEPSNMWSPVGYDTQTNAGYVALDRRTRDLDLDLPTVPSKSQANHLASIYFNENRYEATADIVLRPRFRTIQAGDWVVWNSARYGSRTYIVQSRAIRALTSDGPRNVQLSLQERDGGIYAGVGVIPPTIPMANGDAVYLNELQDYAIIPIRSVGDDGRAYPAFRISWSPIDDPTVTGVIIEWWLATDTVNRFSKQVDAAQSVTALQEGVLSLSDYQIRYKLIADRTTLWTAPVSVTSLDGGNADLEIGLNQVKQDVLNRFSELQQEALNYAPIIEQMLVALSTLGASAHVTSQSISVALDNTTATFSENIDVLADGLNAAVAETTELTGTVNQNKATADQQIAVLVGVDQSQAASLTSLASTVDQNKATLESEISTVATTANAASTAVTNLNATVGANSAGGLVKFAVAANQAGATARFSIAIRANTAAAYVESGMFIEIYNAGGGVLKSRFSVLADQFSVLNPDGSGNSYLPLVFEAGVLKLQGVKVSWADILNVTIGWAQISTAVVNNFVAQNANIGNAVIGTSNLGYSSVTASQSFAASGTGPGNSGSETDFTVIGEFSINNENPSAVMTQLVTAFNTSTSSSSAARHAYVRLVNVTNGTIVREYVITTPTPGNASYNSPEFLLEPAPNSAGVKTYQILISRYAFNASMTVTQQWWKR